MKIYILRKKSIAIILVGILVVLVVIGMITSFWGGTIGGIAAVFSPQKKLPIYSVETEEKKIAISFDAAWGDEFTDDILDTLDKYNVKTTFFLVGFWVDKYPDMVKQIHERGHEIGNHSSTHPHMSKLTKEQIIKELKTTEEKIEAITGVKSTVFRPPFGDYNDLLIETAREIGYHTIQWDVDSLDWKEMGVNPVVDRVTRNVKKGSIVLFHNNAKYVAEYLPLVLEKLQEQGYTIVPISELIIKDNYMMDSTGRQKRVN
ncbi:polysaccharide deacetylase family sporulation protein PdaB [Clostridium formicaceticum]|uniref:Peptidoglycan-N-acetylglucosamine deacetylase n=1 Tax=Clostridium formicaceticum TaxID=1497 RepID=A0AAC9WFC5_9CLOT|nr:polysaccharide deacetylase family sporulation protein PdaB [Clostridium formicaceticum]AOY76228.1 polysaccharide deacetylase family sporulation protein PdaB [Clostridium formicaceticum]ARE86608.1 Peptidoglycan-N-acetylglucosamine deacetylase [Clostridium formicaceticum]